jgi:LysR family transcriptional regulator of gallate degradation
MSTLLEALPRTHTSRVCAPRTKQPDELLNINHLRAFVKVAECGGIASASKELSLSPSSVSRSIQQIEECLGVPLLERHPRGSFLSSYGKQILFRAQSAIRELNAIPRMKMDDRKGAVNSLEHLLNTRRLQMFVKLCELRHMPSVAAEMGISQPAISLGIGILESGVGDVLFERSTLGLAPTRQALAMELRCRRALNELRLIPDEIAALRGLMQGVVTIGDIPLGRPVILPEAIAQATTRHAGLQIVTREDSFDELVAGLRATDIDFIYGPLLLDGIEGHLQSEALFEEDVALLVGQDNALLKKRTTLKDLEGARWILPPKSGPARLLLNSAFIDAGMRPPSPVVESSDLAIIRGLLSKTSMVAALLSYQMPYETGEGGIKRLPVQFPGTVCKMRMGFCYRADSRLSPGAQFLMDAIRGIAEKRSLPLTERPIPL